MGDCNVCTLKYTKQLRKKTKCQYCDYECCLICIKMYIQTQTDVHCMECKKIWSIDFQYSILPKSWINKTLYDYMSEVLYGVEKARLIEDQEGAIREKNRRDYIKKRTRYINEIHGLNGLKRDKKKARRSTSDKEMKKKYTKEINEIEEKIKELGIITDKIREEYYGLTGETLSKERKVFEKKCPMMGCEGYLSTRWKCGICETNVCNNCEEKKGDDHECDNNTMESLKLIKKDSKACPKCSSLIYKINGCDQMWCTQCKVAFSWRTGNVVTGGTIHNPHYIEFMRERGGGMVRDIMDEECGGLPAVNDIKGSEYVIEIYRLTGEINDRIRDYDRNIRYLSDNSGLRINWILGDYRSDQEIKKDLKRRKMELDKKQEEVKIWDVCRRVLTDAIREFVRGDNKENSKRMMREIIEYTNRELEYFYKKRNMSVYQIPEIKETMMERVCRYIKN